MNGQNYLKLILFLAITLLSGISLYSSVKTYTIEESIKTGLENSFDTRSAKLNVEKAQAAVDEAFGTALPSVNISGQYSRNLKVPVFFMPNIFAGKPNEIITVQMGSDNAFSAAASFSQILFNSAVFTGIGTTKTFSNASKDQYRSAGSRTVTGIKKAFYGVLLAKEFNSTMNASFENASENVETVKKLFAEGMIPEFDKIRAEVALENIRPMLLQSEAAVQNAMNGLKMTMGISMTDSIDVSGEFTPPDNDLVINEDEALKTMLNKNSDLQAMNQIKMVNQDIVTMRKSEFYPTLALYGNYVYQGQSNTFDFMTAASSAVGINLSMSLFQGLQSTARVQQAKVDLKTTEIKYQQLEEALKMQLKNSIHQLKISKSKVDAQQKTVQQAERGYEIALIRYKEGTGSQMEINDADGALLQAKINKNQSLYEYISSLADFENLTGTVSNRYFEMLPKVK